MAEANGNTPHAEEEPAAVEEPVLEPQLAAEPEEPTRIPKGLYFVRVPRPEFDESTIKHLQEEVSKQIAKLKVINSKSQIKRGEASALRQQLQDARTIREGSKPDYETKMGRIKELQEMRKSYLDRISDIRSGHKGLEVRSEEDLDAKIASLEEEIASGTVDLRSEKQLVATISKLRGQRDKVRDFQAAQGDLGQLEADLKRVKAMLAEQQDEFKIITDERDQVKVIITDLQAKLKVVTDALSYLDSERSEIEAHKQELQEQLRAAREETDTAMAEYRENRKLSLALRDLVDAGTVAEAAAQAAAQVETYMAKLATDAAYRQEYVTLWCQQRKYLVSDLLPKSGVVAAPPVAAPGKAGAKGGKAPGPAVPQGAAMAQAAIAAALEAADAELAAVRRAAPAPVAAAPSSDEEEDVEEPAPAAAAPAADKQQRRIVPGAPEELLLMPKARQHKAADPIAAAAAHVAPQVEYEYVPPVYDKDGKQEVLSAAEQKERIREEQKRKAIEAEERKRKRQDTATKKRVKAEEAARRTEAEAAARAARAHADTAAAAATAAEAAAQAARDAAPSGTDGEGEGDVSAIITPATSSRGAGAAGSSKAAASRRPPRVGKPAAKKVAITEDPVKWAKANRTLVAVGGCALVLLLLFLLAAVRS